MMVIINPIPFITLLIHTSMICITRYINKIPLNALSTIFKISLNVNTKAAKDAKIVLII